MLPSPVMDVRPPQQLLERRRASDALPRISSHRLRKRLVVEHAVLRQPLPLRRDPPLLGLKLLPAAAVHQAQLAAEGRQPLVRVVAAKQQPVLGPVSTSEGARRLGPACPLSLPAP